MPSFCAVFNCAMRGNRDKASLFRFPAVIKNKGDHVTSISTLRRKKWVMCLKRGELSETQLKYGRVCSKHFISDKPADLLDVHNPDWVPCQNLGYEVGINLKKKASQDRHSRFTKRLKLDEGLSDIAQVDDQQMIEDSTEVCDSASESGTSVQTDLCITPQRTVSYISDAWGGRTSDKFITENSGFLEKILPNDIVMADRGFLINDSVSRLGGKLIIPAFTKGKNQLEAMDLENSRNIAHGPIPMSMVSKIENDNSVLDKIIVVRWAFTNLCPSIIPMY
ncbi:hypothetical protein CBL_12323 [Carabus blaptoides fortunei]